MVKPAGPYLDVLRAVADAVDVPVAPYQVSGEYAMVEAAAAQGWIDRRRIVLRASRASGAPAPAWCLTYWATEAAAWLDEQ
jgi:porphobilinogen synthase